LLLLSLPVLPVHCGEKSNNRISRTIRDWRIVYCQSRTLQMVSQMLVLSINKLAMSCLWNSKSHTPVIASAYCCRFQMQSFFDYFDAIRLGAGSSAMV
jgi:hypothetical protein